MRRKKIRTYVAHTLGLREEVAKEIFPKLTKEFDIVDPFASRRNVLKDLGSEEQIRKEKK